VTVFLELPSYPKFHDHADASVERRPFSLPRSMEAVMPTRTCLLLCFAAASLAHAQPTDDKVKKDLAELQGVWRLVGFEVDGKEAFLQEHKQIRWVIKEDKVFYGGEELAKLTLDPDVDPKGLDLGLTAC